MDIAVLEVGLGGRLDATNIVEPLLSILTDIALDHQDYLGNTITEITREKAGILRLNGTLITLPQHPEANQAIGEAAATLNLRAINAADYIPHTPVRGPQGESDGEATPSRPLPSNHYIVTVGDQALEVDSPLPGHHQRRNIALAIAAAVELRNDDSYKLRQNLDISNSGGYNIPNIEIEKGIRNTYWPGRLELVKFSEGAQLLLDVAHNPAGAWTLRAAIAQLPESQPRTLLFSCLRDKDLREMAQILLPLFDSSSGDVERSKDHIVFAPIENPRAASIEDLLAAARELEIPARGASDLAAALADARAITPADGLVIATGSVYLVGEIRRLAEELGSTLK